jgi:hypothetical protein
METFTVNNKEISLDELKSLYEKAANKPKKNDSDDENG